MDADGVTLSVCKIGNIVKLDIMRNPSGSLGHGEFHIVILYVPERTYIFLSSRMEGEPIDNGNEYTRDVVTPRYSKDI